MHEKNKKRGYKAIVTGRVQGVGFRYFTSRQAIKHDITGHAKNLSDGSVEVLMFGEVHSLQRLLKWLEIGPKTAIVENTRVEEITYREENAFLAY